MSSCGFHQIDCGWQIKSDSAQISKMIFKYQPMQQWRDVVGGEGLPCPDWHCGSHLITSAFQPSNIKPSWSKEYLSLFRFDTSSESPYIRFLVLVIQVWFIRLQKIYLNVNFWVRLIPFMWKFTEQKHLRISEIPNATQSLDLTKLHFPDAAGRITFWWKHIGDLIVLVLALLVVLLHQRDNNDLHQDW